MSPSDRPNPSLWSRFDERERGGGRVRAWVFLTHPGPSLLVTGVLLAATWLLLRRPPDARTAAGLVLAMLPAQLGIGALNDWSDWRLDAHDKPYKPIVRGVVPRRAALALTLTAFAGSVVAATLLLGLPYAMLDVVAIGAGSAYDLALKRTPVAVLAWWAGFATVPLWAMAVAGRVPGPAIATAVPLTGLLALALLLANGLPDIDGDLSGGARTLPALLGARRARRALACALLAAAALVAALTPLTRQGWGALPGAALLAAGAGLAFARGRAVFALLAVDVALASAAWLAALPAA